MAVSVEPRGMRATTVARSLASALVWAVAIALALSAGTVALASGPSKSQARRAPVDLSALPLSTTNARIPAAARDPLAVQAKATSGEVVHPRRVVALFAEPGRRPFAKIGPRQFGPTWLPVVEQRGGWSRVLLPSRPNRSTGWLRTAQADRRSSPYLVKVHVASRRLELFYAGQSLGSWPVAVGKPATPTPVGRTFVLGSITNPEQTFSPVILPLGTHSDTLDSYGGGPGTVALHGWPDPSVFGNAVSHGCIRVPADALDKLTQVPLGTVVLIRND